MGNWQLVPVAEMRRVEYEQFARPRMVRRPGGFVVTEPITLGPAASRRRRRYGRWA